MRNRTCWTPALDGVLRGLRFRRLTWDAIASEMGLSRNTVLERGRKIGVCRGQASIRVADEPADRACRPAGHPATWGMITAGTLLQGEAYPYPVFL